MDNIEDYSPEERALLNSLGGYQKVFDAIANATSIYAKDVGINITVKGFIKSIFPHLTTHSSESQCKLGICDGSGIFYDKVDGECRCTCSISSNGTEKKELNNRVSYIIKSSAGYNTMVFDDPVRAAQYLEKRNVPSLYLVRQTILEDEVNWKSYLPNKTEAPKEPA